MKNIWIQLENKGFIILSISIIINFISNENKFLNVTAAILGIIGILSSSSKIYKDSKENKENFIMWIKSFIVAFVIYTLIYWIKKG